MLQPRVIRGKKGKRRVAVFLRHFSHSRSPVRIISDGAWRVTRPIVVVSEIRKRLGRPPPSC